MVLRCTVDQLNRWTFRCSANVNGERIAVRRAAGKLFQMNGPATVKLLIPSVVLVLSIDSIPVPAGGPQVSLASNGRDYQTVVRQVRRRQCLYGTILRIRGRFCLVTMMCFIN